MKRISMTIDDKTDFMLNIIKDELGATSSYVIRQALAHYYKEVMRENGKNKEK